ncbi:NepR family anti-sigma factor [Sphingomonas bacterium]|uniref:NepR family anti-sigma factor n=1 Tax=Sphingomonas bacterium TaxID=1895847 RepID=UPI0020C658D4|nr:NepR family anti-sigma factor [Sphingomonas bacterium]
MATWGMMVADQSKRKPEPRPRGPKPENDAAMGAALRSVYEKTVEERVPDEFLDLLGKLD